MKASIEDFLEDLGRVKDLHQTVIALRAQTTPAVDLDDVLRAEYVLAVSAFDRFMHEFVRLGMLETASGRRKATSHFQRYQVGLGAAVSSDPLGVWLDGEIRTRNSLLSFQRADKVADAVRLIGDVKLWEEVGNLLGASASDTKNRLNLVVDRRNKIAHEFDRDPSSPGSRWPINEAILKDTVTFLEQVARAIFDVAK